MEKIERSTWLLFVVCETLPVGRGNWLCAETEGIGWKMRGCQAHDTRLTSLPALIDQTKSMLSLRRDFPGDIPIISWVSGGFFGEG